MHAPKLGYVFAAENDWPPTRSQGRHHVVLALLPDLRQYWLQHLLRRRAVLWRLGVFLPREPQAWSAARDARCGTGRICGCMLGGTCAEVFYNTIISHAAACLATAITGSSRVVVTRHTLRPETLPEP